VTKREGNDKLVSQKAGEVILGFGFGAFQDRSSDLLLERDQCSSPVDHDLVLPPFLFDLDGGRFGAYSHCLVPVYNLDSLDQSHSDTGICCHIHRRAADNNPQRFLPETMDEDLRGEGDGGKRPKAKVTQLGYKIQITISPFILICYCDKYCNHW
jgi:hypothetical protein